METIVPPGPPAQLLAPRIGSLFSGYGGLDLGVQAVLGGSVAWHVEYDEAPSRILAHHWPEVPNYGDVTSVDWATVSPIDILTGGYPCQPFSSAGHRKGTNDERHLWPHVCEAIRHLRPRLAFMENVAGHRSLGFDSVLGDLAAIGYDAFWTSLRASDVDAVHGRERVFIAAYPAGTSPGALVPAGGLQVESRGSDRLASSRISTALPVWGPYSERVLRWGRVVGRPAPKPNDGDRLNPLFLEWMMGLPFGHVTDPIIWHGLTPAATEEGQLKALGNGVVPIQASAALHRVLAWEVAA